MLTSDEGRAATRSATARRRCWNARVISAAGNRRDAVDQHSDAEHPDHGAGSGAPMAVGDRRTRRRTRRRSSRRTRAQRERGRGVRGPPRRRPATGSRPRSHRVRSCSAAPRAPRIATANVPYSCGHQKSRQDQPDDDRGEPTRDAVEQTPAEGASAPSLDVQLSTRGDRRARRDVAGVDRHRHRRTRHSRTVSATNLVLPTRYRFHIRRGSWHRR